MRSTTKSAAFNSTLERSDNKLWGAHFEVPKNIAEELIEGKDRRVVCTLNDSAEYQCALLPHGNGTFVISVNKQLRDRLKLSFGMKVDVRVKKDTSKYGLPMPVELRELFKQDKDADRLFHSLTIGKQRTLLYIIGKGRDSDDKILRSLTIANHLKAHSGKINYRQLNGSLQEIPRGKRGTSG